MRECDGTEERVEQMVNKSRKKLDIWEGGDIHSLWFFSSFICGVVGIDIYIQTIFCIVSSKLYNIVKVDDND